MYFQKIAALIILLLITPLSAQPPANYYAGAIGTGENLKDNLHVIISNGHVAVGYNNAWDSLSTIWEDPNNASRLVLGYVGDTRLKSDQCSSGTCSDGGAFAGLWSREHLFPQSEFNGEPMRSDLHALWPVDQDVNGNRSNNPYDNVSTNTSALLTDTGCKTNGVRFQVADQFKGDVARALLYMDVRYNGQNGEPDLAVVSQNCNEVTTDSKIGNMETLLIWNQNDPIDQAEQDRNDKVYAIQHNRNPFVDHPEWVSQIWSVSPTIKNVWINEIHYDNSGADSDEGVELAGKSGTTLAGWTILPYNGSNGLTYTPIGTPSGNIPNQQNNYGTVWINITGLQNGAPDGLALVNPEGLVIQTVSYEGSFVGANGCACELALIDIGASESGTDPIGNSLQLIGSGNNMTDFHWASSLPHTRGLPNNGQTFTGVSRVEDWMHM